MDFNLLLIFGFEALRDRCATFALFYRIFFCRSFCKVSSRHRKLRKLMLVIRNFRRSETEPATRVINQVSGNLDFLLQE